MYSLVFSLQALSGQLDHASPAANGGSADRSAMRRLMSGDREALLQEEKDVLQQVG